MQDNKKAFTLIELLTIISIVVLMTITIFANYGKNNYTFALERSGQKLVQDLRRTQGMAMSGFEENSTGGNAYGIYFDKSSANKGKYIIYLNKNADMSYEGESTDLTKETINLENGIEIYDIISTTGSVDSHPTYISVAFEPPRPLTYVNNNYSGYEATIILRITSSPTETRTIKINNVGRIELTK